MPKAKIDPRQQWRAPPKLPTVMINVRPLNDAVVYTDEGAAIPQDAWTQVPVSAGVVAAIRAGDLEEGERDTGQEEAA